MRRSPRRAGAAVTLVCVVAVAAGGAAGTYRVKKGDTLSGVAGRLGVRVRSLSAANGIRDLDHLVAGRDLTIPGRSSPSAASGGYVVKAGDTLERIARRFGVSTVASWRSALGSISSATPT